MSTPQVPKDVLNLWKMLWESYLNTATSVQDQGNKFIDLVLRQSDAFEKETKKAIKDWAKNVKDIQNAYMGAIQGNLIQQQWENILDLMFQQSEAMGEEGKKVLKEWMQNARNIQKMYLDAIQDNLEKLSEITGQKKKSQPKKE